MFLFVLAAAIATTDPVTNIEVTVTASPIVQTEFVESDGSEVVLLGHDQLSRLNATDLQSALRQVPGVTISRYKPIGSYGGGQGGSVYIRGIGTARPGGEVRMYTDGAPRESGVWGHPLMDAVPIDFADSICVRKNPHPGRSAGTFGAVEVDTKRRREEGYEGELDVTGGRWNTMTTSASAGAKEGCVDAYGGIAYKTSDGARDHDASMLKNAFARTGVDLGETEYISFIYQRTDSKVEDPGVKGHRPPVYDRFDLATDLFVIRLDTDRKSLKGKSLVYVEHGDIGWRKDHLADGNPFSPAGTADTTWLNWGFRSLYGWSPIEHLTLSAGFDVASEGGHTANKRFSDGRKVFGYSARFVTASPYVGARYDIPVGGNWKLTPSAGVRYHFHDVYDNEWAPCAALVLSRDEEISFFVNGSRGVHYPGIYTRAVADDFAKSTLNAEVMNYGSVGAKWKPDDALELSASVFRTYVSDRIDKTATGYVNSGNMKATGVETSVRYRPCDVFTVFAGGTFAAAETHPVSRLPRWTASAGFSWKVCDWLCWDVDGEYIGSMYAYSVRASSDANHPVRLDDGFLFNTRLAVPLEAFLPQRGEVYLALENFTNQHYEYYPGYPMGGIMVYLGVKLKF